MQEPGQGVAGQPVLESGSTWKGDASRWDRPMFYTWLPLNDSRSNRFCLEVKSPLLPLSLCFCRILLSLSLFSLVAADGKGCAPRKSLTQICTDHTEVMPRPTPADAVSKGHWDGRFVPQVHLSFYIQRAFSAQLMRKKKVLLLMPANMAENTQGSYSLLLTYITH